ncbi:MAG: TerB family tellurite resistance protein [Sphingobacteriia bacterium]|nr:TerB family tellurite resistance protein [Sphingobacteriia bacterium]
MSRPKNLSPLDCLSFLYFTAISHDGEITESEIDVFIEKLLEWVPNQIDEVKKSMAQAIDWYTKSNEQGGLDAIAGEFGFCLGVVKENFENKRAVMNDLAAIFEADEKVTKGEQALYDLIRSELMS